MHSRYSIDICWFAVEGIKGWKKIFGFSSGCDLETGQRLICWPVFEDSWWKTAVKGSSKQGEWALRSQSPGCLTFNLVTDYCVLRAPCGSFQTPGNGWRQPETMFWIWTLGCSGRQLCKVARHLLSWVGGGNGRRRSPTGYGEERPALPLYLVYPFQICFNMTFST